MSEKQHILFVDDEENILSGYRRTLRSEREDWQMHFASSAQDAIALLKSEEVDLVLTDIMMPGSSGSDLMEAIKLRWPQVPVIMVTGKVASIEAAVECIKAGACDYLTKPVSREKMIEAVKKGLSLKEENSQLLTQSSFQRRYLAGFEIKRPIDEGSAGVVFLAEKEIDGLRQQVALKILKSMDTIHPDERQEALDRFAREGAVASEINHPNIVKILGYGIADAEKIPYIAMEYIEGQTLSSFMENNKKCTMHQRLGIICDIAGALSAVHEQNICHRDIKPANIIINESGIAKLTDFGLASMPDSTLTIVSSLLGSPAYMSPESFRSSQVDHRADLYSLGIVAYELMVGKLPFNARNLAMLAYEMQNPHPIPPSQVKADIPEALEKVLMKLLEKSPQSRYQVAGHIVDDLRLIQEELREQNL